MPGDSDESGRLRSTDQERWKLRRGPAPHEDLSEKWRLRRMNHRHQYPFNSGNTNPHPQIKQEESTRDGDTFQCPPPSRKPSIVDLESKRYRGLWLDEKRDVRYVEKRLHEIGRKLDKMPEQTRSKFIHLEKHPSIRTAITDLLPFYSIIPIYPATSSHKLAIFLQIATEIGSGDGPTTEQNIRAAYKYVLDIHLPTYCEKLKELVKISPLSINFWVPYRDTGVFGIDEPLAVLARIADSGEHNPDKTHLSLFKEAWDQTSFVYMVDREIVADNGALIDIEAKWRREAGEEPWNEQMDWNATYDKGCVWKEWCEQFSGPEIQDRGILLLLMVVLTPGFQGVSGQKLGVRGGELGAFQVRWIARFVEREVPVLMELVQMLNPWAIEMFQRGYMRFGDQRVFCMALDRFMGEQ